jgi:hypothetical protein
VGEEVAAATDDHEPQHVAGLQDDLEERNERLVMI